MLEILVVLRKGHSLRACQFLLILSHKIRVNSNFSGGQSGGRDEVQGGISNEFPCQPQERFLEVVVGLCGDFEILQVLLPVESHLASFYFTLLDINFVSTQHDGDVFTDALEIAMPIGDIFVGDSRGYIEHDDTTLALDVIAITETTKLFLTSGIPHIKADSTKVGGECEGVNFDTESSNVFLFEFTSQVAFDEGSFSSASVTDEDELECWDRGGHN